MEEWKTYKLGSLCRKVCCGGTPKSTCEQYYGGSIPWLNTKEVNFNRIYSTEFTITQSGLNNSSAKWIDENAVIVAMYGNTAGKVALSKMRLTTNQACCNLMIDESKADHRYIFYYLMSKYVEIKAKANGAAQQNLNAQQIKDLEIPLPPLKIQRQISDILSSIDDKIELNNRINHNLEEQAQALYKSWFVDFEPFNGEMPNTWKSGLLSDILRLKRNSLKADDVGNKPYLPIDIIPVHKLSIDSFAPSELAQSSLQSFHEDDIVIGAMRVYFHRVVIAPCSGVTRNTCFVLEPYDKDALSYCLCVCNDDSTIDYAQNTSKGSTMPYAIWENGLGNMDITIPDKESLSKFHSIIYPILTVLKNSYREQSRLAELRDSILPKLLSGELNINEIGC